MIYLRFVFAAIGALVTVKWVVCLVSSIDGFSLSHSPTVPHNAPDTSQENSESNIECVRSQVLDELSNRVHLLEMAFKEQVFARETIVRDINDQSDIYGSLDSKMTMFLEKLNNVTMEFTALETKYKLLSARVHSDGKL